MAVRDFSVEPGKRALELQPNRYMHRHQEIVLDQRTKPVQIGILTNLVLQPLFEVVQLALHYVKDLPLQQSRLMLHLAAMLSLQGWDKILPQRRLVIIAVSKLG
jgi:hypothetical protein